MAPDPRLDRRLPGFRQALDSRDHTELSAALAKSAGCSRRTIELIGTRPIGRSGQAPAHLADEAD
jgi:hypothetical protein